MAQRRVQVKTCDRCPIGKERNAVETVRFSISDRHYLIDVCGEHRTMMINAFESWARLAVEAPAAPLVAVRDASMFNGRQIADLARAAEQRARQSEIDRGREQAMRSAASSGTLTAELAAEGSAPLSSAAMSWSLTDHARERMTQRGYTLREVLLAAQEPTQTNPSDPKKYGKHTRVHVRGEVAVAVDPLSRTIMTVLHADYVRHQLDQAREA